MEYPPVEKITTPNNPTNVGITLVYQHFIRITIVYILMKAGVVALDELIKIKERVAELKLRIENLEEKVGKLDIMKDVVIEISTTLKYMQKDSEKRDKIFQEQSETLKQVSLTIERINDRLDRNENELKSATAKIEDTNKKLNELSEQIIQDKIQNIKEGSVSINSIWKKIGATALGALITGIIGWILVKLGIIK